MDEEGYCPTFKKLKNKDAAIGLQSSLFAFLWHATAEMEEALSTS